MAQAKLVVRRNAVALILFRGAARSLPDCRSVINFNLAPSHTGHPKSTRITANRAKKVRHGLNESVRARGMVAFLGRRSLSPRNIFVGKAAAVKREQATHSGVGVFAARLDRCFRFRCMPVFAQYLALMLGKLSAVSNAPDFRKVVRTVATTLPARLNHWQHQNISH